jgi:Na+-transporting NADH:ubiquinone oxidoreductase subunit NqrF
MRRRSIAMVVFMIMIVIMVMRVIVSVSMVVVVVVVMVMVMSRLRGGIVVHGRTTAAINGDQKTDKKKSKTGTNLKPSTIGTHD